MYPSQTLATLARQETEVRRRIGVRRGQCVAAATAASEPLVWLDLGLTLWRRTSSVGGLRDSPFGRLWFDALTRYFPRLGRLARWGSLLHGVLGLFSGVPRS